MLTLTAVLALLAGCATALISNNVGPDVIEEDLDEDPPIIDHEPVEGTQTFGVDVPISATVTDDGAGLFLVYLYYKNAEDGSADWEANIMTASDSLYSGVIPGEDQHGSGVDYYIAAVDKEENYAYEPEDGESDPHRFRLAE